MERSRHAAFSAANLRDYSWDFSESGEDADSPRTYPGQISIYVGSQDNSESWIQQDMDTDGSLKMLGFQT